MTDVLKYAAMCWLRYEKGCDIVCTEVGTHYIKDVFGVWINVADGLPSRSIEIEIKVSISDLHADFSNKQQKHKWYSEGRNAPSYLFYLVPSSISERAGEIIRKHSKKYGLLTFNSECFLDVGHHPLHIRNAVVSALRVQKLTDDRPLPALMYQVGRRMMNELFMKDYFIKSRMKNIEDEIKYYAKELTKYERGRVDKYSPFNASEEDIL